MVDISLRYITRRVFWIAFVFVVLVSGFLSLFNFVGTSRVGTSDYDMFSFGGKRSEIKMMTGGGITMSAEFVDESSVLIFSVVLQSTTTDLLAFDPLHQVYIETPDGQRVRPERVQDYGQPFHRLFTFVFPRVNGEFLFVVEQLHGVARRELWWFAK